MPIHTQPAFDILGPDQIITITVAEYHCLTKAAALLEAVLNAKTYHLEAVVDSVRTTINSMELRAEEGAAE